jgi:hypothetical protein
LKYIITPQSRHEYDLTVLADVKESPINIEGI